MKASWCQRYNPTAEELEAQQAAGCRRLHFGARLERSFRADLTATARDKRLSLLIILAVLHLVTPFYYVTLLAVPETFVTSAYAWQYGLQLPAIVIALLVVWRWPASRVNTALCIVVFLALVAGVLGQRAMGMAHGFHVPVEFAAIAIAGFMIGVRIVFWRALPWAIAAAVAIIATEWLFGPGTSAAAYHTLCALMLVGIALFWGYSIELAERNTWLKTRLLDHMAKHDGLTGLLNRPALDQALQVAFDSHAVTPRNVTLAMVDIDYFKTYNDNYGHARGDEIITQVARLCDAAIRPLCGASARYGGEELILLWLGASYDRACERARRMQEQLAQREIVHAGSPVANRLTVSIGLIHVEADQVASFIQAADAADRSPGARLIDIADRLLYAAKHDGRNRMVANHAPDLHASAPDAVTGSSETCRCPEAKIA